MAIAETTATIVNDYGVPARQAAWLVYCASKFDSEIYQKRCKTPKLWGYKPSFDFQILTC